MDIEIFIYGTPIGNSFYGKTDEKYYFDTLYNGSENQNYLLVNVRKAGDNKIYCYYNYLIYQNVIGKAGRPGSFFGITLRLDAYCTDIQNIYNILNTAYNSYIQRELFDYVGGNIKYIVYDFNDIQKMESIKNSVIDLFLRTFKGKENISFYNIDNTFTLGGNKIYTINLYDYPDESILRFIKETGQFRISPYFPTQEINNVKQQNDKFLEEIRQQHESERKADLEEKSQLNNFLSEFKRKEVLLQTKIEQKDKKIRQLEEQLKTLERTKEIEHLIEQISIPVEKLSNYIGRTAPIIVDGITQTGRRWYSRLFEIIRKGIPFVNMFLLVFILLLSINIISPFSYRDTDEHTKEQHLSDKIAHLEKENQELKEKLKVSFPKTGISIDIKDDKEPLKKGKQYTIRSIMKEPAFKWDVKNAQSETTKDGELLITPNTDTETVYISFSVNGETVVEREISVK